ncbi:MAG: ATP-binding protein [Actinomycetota bacterium]
MLTVVVAALAGVVIGGVVAALVFRSTRRAAPAVADPTPPGGRPLTPDDEIALALREAVDYLEIGVVVMSATGRLEYRNRAARAFDGTHVGILIAEEIEQILGEARGGRQARRIVEVQGPPKMWMAVVAEPLPGGSAAATIQDVSERMRTDAMRTDFVTNISHELKTPVGAIAVLAEALGDEPDPDTVTRVSEHLVIESHRAVRTIDDLLRLSQIEFSKLGEEVVEVRALVTTAIGRGQAANRGRDITVTAIDAGTSVHLRCDRRQIESALGNLVENAVKYSHDGGVVQVRTRLDDHAVELMVADQGVGIPARDLDRIFERFYRVDKARSRETGGSGLGLAIVRHVASNHGGDVLVHSQEGEGSTFVLRLPASLLVDEPGTPDDGVASAPVSETGDALDRLRDSGHSTDDPTDRTQQEASR